MSCGFLSQIKRKVIIIIKLVVSATRRSRDIKIPLCLSALVWKSLIWKVTTMDARKSAIFAFQFVKAILQTIMEFYNHGLWHTVLEIQFWSVKYTTAWYIEVSSISIPSHRTMQAITMNGKRTTSKWF